MREGAARDEPVGEAEARHSAWYIRKGAVVTVQAPPLRPKYSFHKLLRFYFTDINCFTIREPHPRLRTLVRT
jgi:hypothetical protein